MAGRHVISVTILGNNRDLNRALSSSSREVNKLAREFKRLNGDVDGAGAAFERFRQNESQRITITEKIERARVGFRRLSDIVGVTAGSMGAWQAAAALAGIAATALSGVLVGAAGGGLVGAFTALWLSTDKAKKEMEKLGKYIRDDLINNTMKPFYDEVAKLPTVLRDSFDAAKPQFEELGKALKPLIADLSDALPGIIKKIVQLFTSVAEAARPFFKAMLDGLPNLIDGIKGFFDAFKNNGDPTVIKKVFRDIGDAIRGLGEFLADLDADDYEKFKRIIVEASRGIIDAVKTVNSIIEKVDGVLRKFGTNIYEVAAASLALGAALRVFGPLLKVFNAGWKKFNELKLGQSLLNLGGEGGGLAKIAGWIPKIAKIGGVITVVTAAFFGWKWVIDEINTEGSKLNKWWRDLTESEAWNNLVKAFNDFKNALAWGFGEIKKLWDETWNDLEADGTIDVLKQVVDVVGDVALAIGGGALKSAFAAFAQSLTIATAGVKIFVEVLRFFVNGARDFMDMLGNIFGGARKDTETSWTGMGDSVKSSFGVMQKVFNGIKDSVSTVVDAFNAIKDKTVDIWNDIKEKVSNVWHSLKDIVVNVADALRDKVREIWDSIRDKVRDINDGIRDKVREIWDAVRDKVREINDAIRDKVREIWDAVRDKVREINDAIRDKVREIWDAVREKVREINDAIREKVREVWDSIREKVREINDGIRDKIATIWTDVKNTIGEKIGNALEEVKSKMGAMLDAIRNKAGEFTAAGRAIIEGLIAGIRAMAQRAIDAAVGVVKNAIAAAKRLLGIRSPSTVFKDVGINIGKGLIIGLDKSEQPVAKAVGDLAAIVEAPNASLASVWEQDVAAAQWATDRLRTIWGNWAKDYRTMIATTNASSSVALAGVAPVEHRTYNLYVTSNSPNAGREIVQEIQKYERINGRSWRS